jgi:glycine/D-amino acid oxidase-like deaminating enzyme
MPTHLQVGKALLAPENIERIKVYPVKHQVTVVSPLDDRDIRNPRRPMVRIRPLEDFQVFYWELETWNNERGIIC